MSGGDLSDYRSFPASSPLAKKSKSNFEGQLVSSPPPSPSSSLSRWLKDGYEENYSTTCSPSSSPLLSGDGEGGRGLKSRTVSIASSMSEDGVGLSYSSVESLSPRKRSGLNSPVAVRDSTSTQFKITILILMDCFLPVEDRDGTRTTRTWNWVYT